MAFKSTAFHSPTRPIPDPIAFLSNILHPPITAFSNGPENPVQDPVAALYPITSSVSSVGLRLEDDISFSGVELGLEDDSSSSGVELGLGLEDHHAEWLYLQGLAGARTLV